MPHAWPRTDRSPIGSTWRAATTSSASSRTPSTPCSRGSRRTTPSSSGSPPTPPTSCAPRWPSPRRCSTSPASDPDRDTDELVERLHAVNARAIALTEALLLLSRTDQRSFTRERVDLSLVAEEAAETLLPLAEARGVTIETAGDVASTVGSHALLLQLTTNLVHNAIVHNLPGGGTVWVTTGARPRPSVLTVENTGDVLTPQLVATLGEPFRRGTERIHADHAGVGLGLAIVESIARAHDGTLTLTPRAGGGLRVMVQLPAAASGN